MEIEYVNLAAQIMNCNACSFRDPEIKPLVAAHVEPPVLIMFIGENPSWEEGQKVPFDVRTVSGRSLVINYLEPLSLTRDQVWITDLFKCRYPKDVYHRKQHEEERIQSEVVATCVQWLVQEISFARPKVIVTLSDRQVFRRLRSAFSLATPARFARAAGKPHNVELGGIPVVLFPMVHPDVARPLGQGDARKPGPRKKWAPIHRRNHLPALASLIKDL
jgi:uracil-DNA glycosylase family 4